MGLLAFGPATQLDAYKKLINEEVCFLNYWYYFLILSETNFELHFIKILALGSNG
jgi:hypothetical protein